VFVRSREQIRRYVSLICGLKLTDILDCLAIDDLVTGSISAANTVPVDAPCTTTTRREDDDGAIDDPTVLAYVQLAGAIGEFLRYCEEPSIIHALEQERSKERPILQMILQFLRFLHLSVASFMTRYIAMVLSLLLTFCLLNALDSREISPYITLPWQPFMPPAIQAVFMECVVSISGRHLRGEMVQLDTIAPF
jgi:hypothetical protein